MNLARHIRLSWEIPFIDPWFRPAKRFEYEEVHYSVEIYKREFVCFCVVFQSRITMRTQRTFPFISVRKTFVKT